MTKIKKGELGEINSPLIGIAMKEMVRRAITTIRNHRTCFEVQCKVGHDGEMNDVFTNADKAAQEVYLRTIRECFPDYGVIAEEDNLKIECNNPYGLYFTIDPLDGTKAFVRRQSHGVGTMISLCRGKEFLAAYVGDVNTQEIYGFRPESDKVHRITEYNSAEELTVKSKKLIEQYGLLRDPVPHYCPLTRSLLNVAFRSHTIDGGSIGIWFARLWKGEVGALIIPPSLETPWDSNPVNAITRKMGFKYLRPWSEPEMLWDEIVPEAFYEEYRRTHDIMVVHGDNLGDGTIGLRSNQENVLDRYRLCDEKHA